MKQRNSLMYERFETLSSNDRQIPMLKFSFTDFQPQSQLKAEATQKRVEPQTLVMGNPFSKKETEVCRPIQKLYNPTDAQKRSDAQMQNDSQMRSGNSERSEQWKKDATQQAKRPITPDIEGRYEVQKGDSLWGITKRLLESEGQQKATPKQFNEKLKELIDLNKDRYPGLECSGLIKPGMKLAMKKAEFAQQKPGGDKQSTDHGGETYNLYSVEPSKDQV